MVAGPLAAAAGAACWAAHAAAGVEASWPRKYKGRPMGPRLVYNLLLVLSAPFVWLRLRVRAWREPAYAARRGERCGRVPAGISQGVVWIHVVSAGEANGAVPVVRGLSERLPGQRFLVTTMTPAGSAAVLHHLGDIVEHCYAPYDFPWAVARFVARVRPRILVLMETELWPNLIRATRRAGAPVAVINARLSRHSARGYARVGCLTRQVLADIDSVMCQYQDTARRFKALGAPAERVAVTGSVKFDWAPPPDSADSVARLARVWAQGRPVWVAGSTHPGEEAVVLGAQAALVKSFPNLLLVLAPRHPTRTADIERLCAGAGLTAARWSDGAPGAVAPQVLLVDEMGRLAQLYGIADVAVLCGSFTPIGGHNPIEAALHGVPMLMGPHRFNWVEVERRFKARGCLGYVAADTLADAVAALLADPAERERQGRAARETALLNRGAGARLTARLAALIVGGQDAAPAPARLRGGAG